MQGACREGQLTFHGGGLRYENGVLGRRYVICEKLACSWLLQAKEEGNVVGSERGVRSLLTAVTGRCQEAAAVGLSVGADAKRRY